MSGGGEHERDGDEHVELVSIEVAGRLVLEQGDESRSKVGSKKGSSTGRSGSIGCRLSVGSGALKSSQAQRSSLKDRSNGGTDASVNGASTWLAEGDMGLTGCMSRTADSVLNKSKRDTESRRGCAREAPL